MLAQPVTLPDLVDTSFRPIARATGKHLVVLVRLLEIAAELTAFVRRRTDRDALHRAALFVAASGRAQFEAGSVDRDELERALADALAALHRPAASSQMASEATAHTAHRQGPTHSGHVRAPERSQS